MELKDLQLNRQLYRTQPQTVETLGADSVASNLSAPPSTAIASGNSVTDVNTNAETINGSAITPGTIPAETLDVSNWGWTQTCAFTSASATQVNWGSGSFISANGVTYAIAAGNTGSMAAKTYIYLDLNVSSTAYQHTTTSANAVGVGKVLVAVAQNGASSATFNLNVATQIVGDNILANTIDASKITAGSITATQISVSYVYAGTITADQVTAGTMTGSTVQTSATGHRVVMNGSGDNLEIYNSNDDLTIILDGSETGAEETQIRVGGGVFMAASIDATDALGTKVYSATDGFGGVLALIDAVGSGSTGSLGIGSGGSLAFFGDGASEVFTVDNVGRMNTAGVDMPLIYYGYGSGTTVSRTNSSFTMTNPSTGKYTITHNFGNTNYTAVTNAVVGAGSAYTSKIEGLNSNTLQVTVFDDTGIARNSDFTFLITKI